ncbi:hypothetical protein TrVE_jg13650 [Triparma verrucosa]|uniref:Uncharacterized protein n=1 Tax=Triparma verrucosa TaxID=1606542 RepID=A0A9W7F6P3_9STRA|nr:hypothetical protein TrVE_jg13650 [Triparma verrucosa]
MRGFLRLLLTGHSLHLLDSFTPHPPRHIFTTRIPFEKEAASTEPNLRNADAMSTPAQAPAPTAARWSQRSTKGKRSELPSPAVGSPAAQAPKVTKKVNMRKSPVWDGSGAQITASTTSAVNELITSNQRAFAARFGGGSGSAPPSAATSTSSTSPSSSNSSTTGMLSDVQVAPGAQQMVQQVAAQQQQPVPQTTQSKSAVPQQQQQQQQTTKQATAPQQKQQQAQSATSSRPQQQQSPYLLSPQGAPKSGSAPAQRSSPPGTYQPRPGGVQINPISGQPMVRKVGPPVVENQIGMGGLQSPVQVGGAGFSSESSSKKSGSSRRRSSSKKNGSKGGGGRWTKEEDQKLRAAVAAVGPQNWKMIAQDFLGDQRSDVQCLHRWQKVLQPGLVKGPWTKEEDQIIIDCIDAGITKWSEIAERIPGRIGKQCRERWFNHLDPSLKKGGWTEEEDAILVEAQAKWGNCWTKIAKLLPGRSENAVKNRWNSATRRRAKINAGTEGIVETRYLENLSDPTTSMFPDGLDTTASAVLAAARAAAAKIIAEENGKIEPEDDDPDTIKLSQEAKIALLSKKRHHTLEDGTIIMGDSTDGLFLDEEGKPLIMGEDSLDSNGLPSKSKSRGGLHGIEEVDIATMDANEFFHIPENDKVVASSPSSKKKSGGGSKSKKKSGAGMGGGAVAGDEESDSPDADGPSNSFLFFEDQNLTEREKDLIHRAYLAGVASKGEGIDKQKASGGSTRKGSRRRTTKKGGGVAVQWDFGEGGGAGGSGRGGQAGFGMDYLNEHGVDVTKGASGVILDEDSALSSSLLNMSMDKDMIMEDMGLSLSDKSVLTRPLSHGAMQSLHTLTPVDKGNAATAKVGSGEKVKPAKAGGGAMKMSPTASALHQITADYREGLITEEEKEERKAAMLGAAKKSTEKGGKGVDPDLLDADQSVDLSADLAQFIGSPNLMWSLSHSGGSNGGESKLSPVPVGAVAPMNMK